MPESIFSADSTAYVREWLRTKVKVRAIVSLPIETFSPFGANVKTGILFARKWKPGEITSAPHKVCMLKIETVGYDASGRPKSADDLGQASCERWRVELFTDVNSAAVESHWPLVAISELADESSEAILPSDCIGDSLLYVGLENVESVTGEPVSLETRGKDSVKSRSKVFCGGDILYGRAFVHISEKPSWRSLPLKKESAPPSL